MRPDDDARFEHMLDAVDKVLRMAEGKDFEEYVAHDLLPFASARLLEILGEAAVNVSPATQSK